MRSSGTGQAPSWAFLRTTSETSSSRRSTGTRFPSLSRRRTGMARPSRSRSWSRERWSTRPLQRAAERGGQARNHRICRRAGLGQAYRHVSAARLAYLPPALLGHAYPHDLLPQRRGTRAGKATAGGTSRRRGVQPDGRVSVGQARGLRRTSLPHVRHSCDEERTRWTRSWTPTGTSSGT